MYFFSLSNTEFPYVAQVGFDSLIKMIVLP